jgi:hypothetical protein
MKIKKMILTVVGLFLFGLGAVLAQNERSPISIEQVHSPGIEHNDAVKNFALDFLLTVDFSSFVDGPLSQGNISTIKQYGYHNTAILDQSGTGNTGYIQMGTSRNFVTGNEAIVNQDGIGLISLIGMMGNNNYLEFDQMGNNKGALFYFQGDYLQFEAQQIGAGLQLWPKNTMMSPIEITSNQRTVPVIISN